MLLFSEYNTLPNPKDYWYNSLVVNYSYFWFALYYVYYKILNASLLHTNYLLSTTHSVLMNFIVLFTVIPNLFNGNVNHFMTGNNWYDFVLGINNGYLIYDIFWIYFNYADMKIDSQKFTKIKLIHHGLYLTSCYLSVKMSVGTYFNTLLLLNTLTTPFLNWRRFNKHRNISYSKKIMYDTLFYVAFFSCRVLFNLWFCMFPLQRAILTHTTTLTTSQNVTWYTLIGLYYANLFFNLVWFSLVSKKLTVKILHYIITRHTNKAH
jgi:hypothetical protein